VYSVNCCLFLTAYLGLYSDTTGLDAYNLFFYHLVKTNIQFGLSGELHVDKYHDTELNVHCKKLKMRL